MGLYICTASIHLTRSVQTKLTGFGSLNELNDTLTKLDKTIAVLKTINRVTRIVGRIITIFEKV
ncbi:hypothetical protein NUACC21_78090 [Scytonema sp. NUACC21]